MTKAASIQKAMFMSATHVCCPMHKTTSCNYTVCCLYAVHSMGKLETADDPEHMASPDHAGIAARVVSQPFVKRVAGSTIWSILGMSVVMQEQTDKHIFPVQASKPARRLLRLLLVLIHCTDYQLNCILGQQVSPASQVSVIHAEAVAAVQFDKRTEKGSRCVLKQVCFLCQASAGSF